MQSNLLKLVGHKCGECRIILGRYYQKCEDCNMILCESCRNERDDKFLCSSCFMD